MKWWLVLTVILFASNASAQEADTLRLPVTIYAASALADAATTARCFELFAGCQERNPLFHWTQNAGGTYVAASLLVADTLTALVLTRYVAPRHPRLAKTLLYVGASINFSSAALNLHAEQRALALR